MSRPVGGSALALEDLSRRLESLYLPAPNHVQFWRGWAWTGRPQRLLVARPGRAGWSEGQHTQGAGGLQASGGPHTPPPSTRLLPVFTSVQNLALKRWQRLEAESHPRLNGSEQEAPTIQHGWNMLWLSEAGKAGQPCLLAGWGWAKAAQRRIWLAGHCAGHWWTPCAPLGAKGSGQRLGAEVEAVRPAGAGQPGHPPMPSPASVFSQSWVAPDVSLCVPWPGGQCRVQGASGRRRTKTRPFQSSHSDDFSGSF
ncbi:hypothetical protein H8959_003258 [Pygathrix nigripes]